MYTVIMDKRNIFTTLAANNIQNTIILIHNISINKG
jgi:hypothetical protein